MKLLPAGPHAVLVEVADTAEALSLADWARDLSLATDVVPGAVTVLLDGVADPARLPGLLATWTPGPRPEPGPVVELPTTYDGPDLETVAGLWGCDVEEAVALHLGTEFVAAFCGFAPGFAYLTGLGGAVPRLDTPRTRVPAGSVALAGPWCAVYPRETPGGWRIIGHTDEVLWDADRDPPARLAPGTRVRFTAS